MGKGKTKSHKHNKKTGKDIKSREDLLLQQKINELQIRMLDDDTINANHIKSYTKVATDNLTLNVQDPFYIRDNIELMKVWLECAQKSIQATLIMNDDSITETISENLQNSEYIKYVQSVIDTYD